MKYLHIHITYVTLWSIFKTCKICEGGGGRTKPHVWCIGRKRPSSHRLISNPYINTWLFCPLKSVYRVFDHGIPIGYCVTTCVSFTQKLPTHPLHYLRGNGTIHLWGRWVLTHAIHLVLAGYSIYIYGEMKNGGSVYPSTYNFSTLHFKLYLQEK